MPLPPAPTKRAALLSPDALDAPARSSHRGSRRSGDSRADEAAARSPQPLELFDRPGNLFVAQFIGSPAMNVIQGTVRTGGGRMWVESQGAQWPGECCFVRNRRLA